MIKRNIWCPGYDKCLEKAISSDIPFDCRGCDRENDREGENIDYDLFGCCLLIAALFCPEAYNAYQLERMRYCQFNCVKF
mgnify:CR=1 FL=1